jgi:ATP-binding cassette, subfamily B, bacterial MsbA
MERSTFDIFRALVRSLGISLARVPYLIGVGLAAALIDAFTIGLVVALLFALLSSAPTGGIPGQMIALVGQTIGRDWTALAAGLVVLVLAKLAVGLAYQAFTIRFKNEINGRVLSRLHARLLDMRYQDLRAHGQGDLLNLTAKESWQVANAAYLLSRIAINGCTIIVFGLLVFMTSWVVAVMTLAGVIVAALGSRFLGAHARAAGVRARAGINTLYSHIVSAIQAARLIRAFSAEDRQKQLFNAQADVLRRDLAHAETLQSLSGPISELSYVLLLIALVAVSRALAIPDAASLTAVALIYRMAPHARELEANRHALAGLYAPLSAVLELMTEEHEPPSRARHQVPSGDMTISFENVSHHPAGAAMRVLDGVTFAIPSGATTVLSGPSGSGKTSIVNLLLRLYEPESGVIRIGGTDLSSIGRAEWLAGVGVAGQDMDLVEGTVADNIGLGSGRAGPADVRNAAEAAGALSFIEALPYGFQTWIGSFGYNLSGGQRQRLSIARAVLREPQLLILDESTNAIEDTLEHDVLRNIRRRLPRSTILIITHRPNEACPADHVVRLAGGRVVAELLPLCSSVQR